MNEMLETQLKAAFSGVFDNFDAVGRDEKPEKFFPEDRKGLYAYARFAGNDDFVFEEVAPRVFLAKSEIAIIASGACKSMGAVFQNIMQALDAAPFGFSLQRMTTDKNAIYEEETGERPKSNNLKLLKVTGTVEILVSFNCKQSANACLKC